MLWNTKGTLPMAGVAVLGLLLGGCASTPERLHRENQATVIQVQNLNQNRVVVDALSGGIDRRLGAVETTETDDFVLPESISLTDLQILVDPVGPAGSYLSDRVAALPGDLVEVRVQPNLDLTTVTVR